MATAAFEVEAESPEDAESMVYCIADFAPSDSMYFERHDARTDDISEVEE